MRFAEWTRFAGFNAGGAGHNPGPHSFKGPTMTIQTQDGKLTDYGFDCGYVERIDTPQVTATVKKMHGAYRITGFVRTRWFNVNRRTVTEVRRVASRLRRFVK